MNRDFLNVFEIYSLHIEFIQTIVFIVLFLVITGFLFFILKNIPTLNFPKINKKDQRTEIKIHPHDPKKTAYEITFLIHKIETPYNEELLNRLEKFKYRREVENFDPETIELIKRFIEYVKEYGSRI